MKHKLLVLPVGLMLVTSLVVASCAGPAPAPTPVEPIKIGSNISKAEKIGYKPEYNLETGLKQTIESAMSF